MSVVVSDTEATNPTKARAKDGVVVTMGKSRYSRRHSARVFRGDVVACDGLLRALAEPGRYLPAFASPGAAASPFRAVVSNGSVTLVPSENSVVFMPDLKSRDTDCGSGAGRATSTNLPAVRALARA